jgi:glycerol-3-phosphate dehydrogenase
VNSTVERYRLLVIGGGINGAAIACDAAGRGATVALAEARDFSEGTSSRSSKLIHGGLRYLETYDFGMVRESLLEREILMRKAPHLVWPLRLVLPHVPSLRPLWLIRTGLFLYDHLARRDRLPPSQLVSLDRHEAGLPLKADYRRGFAYSDCRCDDSRLVIANILGAAAHGAAIFARHSFERAERGDDAWHVTLRRRKDGAVVRLTADAIINAAGPWVPTVAETISGTKIGRSLCMVKGSHLVVPRLWPGEHGYYLQTRDGRGMEMFPFEDDFTSIGTTDEPWERDPEDVEIAQNEIDYMLDEVNQFLKDPIRQQSIVWMFAGVRPLFLTGSGRDASLSSLTRDYAFEVDHRDGRLPLLTVFGGKLTTHRKLAEKALDRLARFVSYPGRCRTEREILPGGEAIDVGAEYPWLPVPLARRFARTYGSRTRELLKGLSSTEGLGRDLGAGLHEAEVEFLRRTEWAETAEDILWRRTKLGLRLSAAQAAGLESYLEG